MLLHMGFATHVRVPACGTHTVGLAAVLQPGVHDHLCVCIICIVLLSVLVGGGLAGGLLRE